MSYLFGHYSGDPITTGKAIATLQEFDLFFHRYTPIQFTQAPLVHQLLGHKQRMEKGLGMGEFRFTVREARDISRVYVYCGMTSRVSWAGSIQAGRLIFENVLPVAAERLYPPSC